MGSMRLAVGMEHQARRKINPIRFELGAITTEGKNLMVQGQFSATTQTLIGDNPVNKMDTILPPLLKRLALPDQAYFICFQKSGIQT